MKKKTVLYASLMFLFLGCHTSETYYKLDAIRTNTILYYWNYNSATLSYELAQKEPEEGKAYPFDALYWEVSYELVFANSVNLNWIQKSYAFQYDKYFYNMYDLKSIYFITRSAYNEDYQAGDTINDMVGIINQQNDTLSIKEIEDSLESFSYYSPLFPIYPFYIYLKQKPELLTDFSIQVVFEFDQEIFIHQTSHPVQIF